MDAAQFLPTEPSPEVTQIHEGDYKDADGLPLKNGEEWLEYIILEPVI